MRRKDSEVFKYLGGNETIDRMTNPSEELWIVNSSAGRKVLILSPGSTADEAWALYVERWDTKAGGK